MNPDKMFLAAQQAHQAGKLTTAQERYTDLVRIFPDHAEGWHFLGIVYSQQGDFERGIEAIEKALTLQPNHPIALVNLGESLARSGDPSGAVRAFENAIKLEPHLAQAHFNLANILKQRDHIDDAISHYQAAIEIQPQYTEAWFNLGNTCMARGMFRSAAQSFERALAIKPDHAEALLNLGVAYIEMGDVQKSVNRYREVLQLAPDSFDAHRNLGYALEKQGDIPGALESFRKALDLEPGNALFHLYVETLCPPIMANHAELDAYRAHLREVLNSLSGKPFLRENLSGGESYFPSVTAYHGGNDLPLKKQWSALFRPYFEEKRPKTFIRREPTQPIHVGFVVTHGHEGVFLKCMRGIINRLPERGHFDITVVCSRLGGAEILADGITHPAIRFVALPSDLDEAAEIVRPLQFDILHYWEVGTDSLNYFLPFYRLAPVQCATWGWPVTTGIPEVDYFISSEGLETANSDGHYSEKLIRFNRLPVYYHMPPIPLEPRPRAVFGLGSRDHIYLCTQNLRKVHPDMDRIFEELLEQDEQGRVLLIQDAQPGVTDLLRRRFRREIPSVADRISFLPRLPEKDYLNVVMLADGILDTLHYTGGANTTYDAFAAGTPIVTLPMRYHRGRYTAAAYEQMGFTDLIAGSAEEYVRLALELGNHPAFRTEMRSKILENAPVLFEDDEAVDELAEFFEAVVNK